VNDKKARSVQIILDKDWFEPNELVDRWWWQCHQNEIVSC